jgi:catechol 2,3-dioxygenase-like lactoylglutathione lyase family enzyme
MGGPTPELDVSDLDRSLAFYVGVIGFAVMFDRPEERFAFLTLEGVHLMLEEAAGPGRRFRTAPLEHPYGRGVNFMIEVAEIDRLHSRVQAAGSTIVIPLEERWYPLRHSGSQNEVEHGRKQFVIADPDGYLLRFSTSLGQRPAQGPPNS